jgi:superfamily II DNA helicase RecQ
MGDRLRIDLALLDAMEKYCMDQVTCRRQMILNYFSEEFHPYNCRQNCDNCVRKAEELMTKKPVDLTPEATAIAAVIREIYETRPDAPPYPTASHVIDVILGSTLTRLKDCGDCTLPSFGRVARWRDRRDLLAKIFPILQERQVIRTMSRLGLHGLIQYWAPDVNQLKDPVVVDDFTEAVPARMNKQDANVFTELIDMRKKLAVGDNGI